MAIRFDNTASVKAQAKFGVPPCPAGREEFTLSIGDEVLPTGNGTYKEGCKVGKIMSMEKNNGFNRYMVLWFGHQELSGERSQDIRLK